MTTTLFDCDSCALPVYADLVPGSPWFGFWTHTHSDAQLCDGSRDMSDPAATVKGREGPSEWIF